MSNKLPEAVHRWQPGFIYLLAFLLYIYFKLENIWNSYIDVKIRQQNM